MENLSCESQGIIVGSSCLCCWKCLRVKANFSLCPTFTVRIVRVLLAEGVEEGPGADGDAEGVGGGELLVDNDNVDNYLQLIM